MIRRNLLVGFIISIFILPVRGRTIAQTSASVELFNSYYQESIEELRQLYSVRQAVFSCEPINNPFESIKKFLSVYKSNKAKTGVIFYIFDSRTVYNSSRFSFSIGISAICYKFSSSNRGSGRFFVNKINS